METDFCWNSASKLNVISISSFCRLSAVSSRWQKYTRNLYNPFLIGVLLCLIHFKDCNSNLVQIVKLLPLLYAYVSQNFILIRCVCLFSFYAFCFSFYTSWILWQTVERKTKYFLSIFIRDFSLYPLGTVVGNPFSRCHTLGS